MVGHETLDLGVVVRIHAGQPFLTSNPFDEQVEGASVCDAKSCATDGAVLKYERDQLSFARAFYDWSQRVRERLAQQA